MIKPETPGRNNMALGICMIIFSVPPIHTGAGYQALRLAIKLARNGIKCFFLTAKQDNSLENPGIHV